MNGTPPVLQEEPEGSPPAASGVLGKVRSGVAAIRSKVSIGLVLRVLLSFGLVALILLVVLPKAIGATVNDVGHALTQVNTLDLLGLAVLWFGGLLIYSFVLTGSLQGLRTGQALTLNMTGSAVANVVPFGGAVGMSLNYYMLRTWDMSLTEFSSYTVVTNVWNILMKLSMPAIALVFAVESGVVVSHRMATIVVIAVSVLTVVVIAIVTGLASQRLARRFARGLAAAIGLIAGLFKREVDRARIEAETIRTRDMVAGVVRVQWMRLTTFMTGYGIAQAALLYACVQAVHLHVSPAAVVAAYAVERFLSMVPITPAGLGFTQAGAAGILVVMGNGHIGTAAQMAHYDGKAAAAVLLYSAFVTALEVPVGGVWLGIWYYLQRRKRHHLEPEVS